MSFPVRKPLIPQLRGPVCRPSGQASAGLCLIVAALLMSLSVEPAAAADRIRLKNGTVLEGRAEEIRTLDRGPLRRPQGDIEFYPIWMITNDLTRYFVSRHQVANIEKSGGLDTEESFKIQQEVRNSANQVGSVGAVLSVDPFDKFGRRTIRLLGAKAPIIQGIVELTPTVARIKSLQGPKWETAVATSSIPTEQLAAILLQTTDASNSDHQLGLVRFLMQAELYQDAQIILSQMHEKFPAEREQVDQARRELTQLQARQLLTELKRRQSAGQHQLLRSLLPKFPTQNVAAAILQEVQAMQTQDLKQIQQIDQATIALGECEAAIEDPKQLEQIKPIRTAILEQLSANTIPRLEPFLRLAADTSLAARDKLALAISGWVLGANGAIDDLPLALRLWRARELVQQYVAATDVELLQRKPLLEQIKALEGISTERIAQMVPYLPPVRAEESPQSGNPIEIKLQDGKGNTTLRYWVSLPPEYSHDRVYPTLVALHSEAGTSDRELIFWAGTGAQPGQAARHGYIVIAPDYNGSRQSEFDYSAASHQRVLDALTDARKRFSIDNDRVFLTGHGKGGDATFDIGFAHPDLFAGLIPMAGVSDKYCQVTWQNARHLPMYVILGELDRDTVLRNTRELERMLVQGLHYDLIYAEFRGAGFDSFYDEIQRLFQWMSTRRRNTFNREFESKAFRQTDNRFWWLEFEGLPPKVLAVNWDMPGAKQPMQISAKISEANLLRVSCRADRISLWLSPQLINFDNRLQVQVNEKKKFNDFIKPDLAALLEDLCRRGDRQQLYWAVLEF